MFTVGQRMVLKLFTAEGELRRDFQRNWKSLWGLQKRHLASEKTVLEQPLPPKQD